MGTIKISGKSFSYKKKRGEKPGISVYEVYHYGIFFMRIKAPKNKRRFKLPEQEVIIDG